MTNKTIYAGIILAFVIGISISGVYANPGVPSSVTDLESSFAGFEAFLTALTAEVDANTLAVFNLQGDITSIEGDLTIVGDHINDHHTEVAVLNAENDGIEARLVAIETNQFTNEIDLTVSASDDGKVEPRTQATFYFGNQLCKIEASTSIIPTLYLKFGSTTTVKHLTDCAPTQNGVLISLTNSTDQVFLKGQILVLKNNFSVFDEVTRDLTP